VELAVLMFLAAFICGVLLAFVVSFFSGS